MHQLETIQKFRLNTSLVVALPVLVIAVLCADGIRLYAQANPVADSGSIIEATLASWQESAANNDGLDKTLSSHYIQLNDQNRLSGSVSAIQKGTGDTIAVGSLEVKLIQRSQEVTRTTTVADGTFLTDVVEPGSYTLCISGSEGFLAYGVQIIENDVAPAEMAPADAVPVPQIDDEEGPDLGNAARSTRNRLITYKLPAQQDDSVQIYAAVIPPTHNVLEEIMQGIPMGAGMGTSASGGTQINVEESVVAGGFQVVLQEDGKLVGRVAPLTSEDSAPIRLREMNIYLLKDDEIVDQVIADEDGNFVFSGVEADVYGFAAAGRDGFAALSFQAIDGTEDLNSSIDDGSAFQNASASMRKEPSDVLQVAICPPEDIPYLRREIENLNREPVNEEFGGEDLVENESMLMDEGLVGNFGDPAGFDGGGFGFDGPMGGGGGYGGPGIGSSIGPLVEVGLAAWLISELFDDADNNVNPQPVSPFFVQPLIVGNQ